MPSKQLNVGENMSEMQKFLDFLAKGASYKRFLEAPVPKDELLGQLISKIKENTALTNDELKGALIDMITDPLNTEKIRAIVNDEGIDAFVERIIKLELDLEEHDRKWERLGDTIFSHVRAPGLEMIYHVYENDPELIDTIENSVPIFQQFYPRDMAMVVFHDISNDGTDRIIFPKGNLPSQDIPSKVIWNCGQEVNE